jgi:hypothetical protein
VKQTWQDAGDGAKWRSQEDRIKIRTRRAAVLEARVFTAMFQMGVK